jgi:hypothetical protein
VAAEVPATTAAVARSLRRRRQGERGKSGHSKSEFAEECHIETDLVVDFSGRAIRKNWSLAALVWTEKGSSLFNEGFVGKRQAGFHPGRKNPRWEQTAEPQPVAIV